MNYGNSEGDILAHNPMLTQCSLNIKWALLQQIGFNPNYNIYSTFVQKLTYLLSSTVHKVHITILSECHVTPLINMHETLKVHGR